MTNEDLGTIFFCAFRYCLGRATYMPHEFMRIASNEISNIPDRDLILMDKEITEAGQMSALGMDFDADAWYDFQTLIQTELKKRKNNG